MVQKVVGSIPITHPISECSTAVSIQVFQTWDESSILSTRTRTKKSICALIFLFQLFVKFGGNVDDLPRHPKLEGFHRIHGAN